MAGLARKTNMRTCYSCRAPRHCAALASLGQIGGRRTRLAMSRALSASASCVRSVRHQRATPFVAKPIAAAQRACGGLSRAGQDPPVIGAPPLCRGRVPSSGRTACSRVARVWRPSRPRSSVIRCVRRCPPAHVGYLLREGLTRDWEKARLFGPTATRPISSRSVSAAKGSGGVHLGQPLRELLRQTSDAYPGVTVRAPATGEHECALRFFANGRLEEADISAATSPPRTRITTIFLIQDTSEFSFQRPDTSAICMTQSVHSSRDKVGGFYCLTVTFRLPDVAPAVSPRLYHGAQGSRHWGLRGVPATRSGSPRITGTEHP
ncbi:hypothetical protein ABH999_000926 [Bradyrhizobium yuanmingense]